MTLASTKERPTPQGNNKAAELINNLKPWNLPEQLKNIITAIQASEGDNLPYSLEIISRGERVVAKKTTLGKEQEVVDIYELKIEKARKPEEVTTAETPLSPTVFLIIEQAEDYTTLRQATVVLALTQTEDDGNIHQTIKPWLPENIHSLLKQELQNAPSRITANNEHLTPHGGTIQIIMEFGPGGPYYTVHLSLYLIDEKRPSTPPQPFQKSITLLPSATEAQVQATDDTPEQAG